MKDNTLRESNTRVKDMVNELETITYYKHHYVRKTGLKKAIKALLAEEVRKELEYILTNSSGGGSWRRNIITRLAELEKEGK